MIAGFVADPVGRLIKKTLLNPALTVPILLLAKYTSRGQQYAFSHRRTLRAFDIVVYWGVLRWLNNFLNRRALSNGVSDKYDWSKEVVIVTGGSDGIGKAVVQLLAAANVKVAVLDVQSPTYESPPSLKYFQCDISSSSAIAKVASEVRAQMGEPTVLMNIAGVANGKTILDATEAEHRWIFDVNSLSHYLLAKEFVPSMVSKDHGMVVTIASLASYGVVANNVDYSASKAGALSFHEGLTTELVTRYNAPRVRTLLVTPGPVNTPLIAGWNQRQGFLEYLLEPETLAEEIVKRVLAGQSGQLILPGWCSFLFPLIRAMPYWITNPMRNKKEHVLANWHGRVVGDPNKKYAGT
jgi:all-trans-retinol dehydrogenase (NAD+)